jgi:hypothetical protein
MSAMSILFALFALSCAPSRPADLSRLRPDLDRGFRDTVGSGGRHSRRHHHRGGRQRGRSHGTRETALASCPTEKRW